MVDEGRIQKCKVQSTKCRVKAKKYSKHSGILRLDGVLLKGYSDIAVTAVPANCRAAGVSDDDK